VCGILATAPCPKPLSKIPYCSGHRFKRRQPATLALRHHLKPSAQRENSRRSREKEERAFYHRRVTPEWREAIQPLGLDEHRPFLEIAPYLIVIFSQQIITDDQGRQHKNYYSIESAGIATGLLITALHLAGLTTLTHTPSPMRFLNQLLDRPFLILVTGYPSDEAQVPVITKHPLERFTTFIGP
jgi:hypothetical protein